MTSSTDTLEKLIEQLTNNVNTLGIDIKQELNIKRGIKMEMPYLTNEVFQQAI